MGKQFNNDRERLSAFSKMEDQHMEEGTSTYYKFNDVGQKVDGIFKGLEDRVLDSLKPDKKTECAIIENENGERLLMAQTIIVNELKKKWDATGEVGFPCRIIYAGKKGDPPNEYQSFRILFEPEQEEKKSKVKPSL